jgi:hypothetical protein
MRRAVNIVWDIDDWEDYVEDDSEIGLPTDVIIPDEIEDDFIEDYLSDEFGYCTLSFSIVD